MRPHHSRQKREKERAVLSRYLRRNWSEQVEIGPNKWKLVRTSGNWSEQVEIDPTKFELKHKTNTFHPN